MDRMNGVVLTGHGGFERLVWRDDLERPKPTTGEVLIKLGGAAVNNTDINTRLAWYSKGDGEAADATWSGRALVFPHIQGIDGCGEVVALGDGADETLLGKRVLIEPCLREARGETLDPPWFLGSECPGTFAEYVTVSARHAHVIDSELSDVALATFPCSYSTAENMIVRSQATAGERALVTGASGGVGSAAIQLLVARGVEVTAVTSPG
ncbi:MAG: alcohol dehydrogenase catalytic domain-containing protein, partial [Pseudomonadota bacterium]